MVDREIVRCKAWWLELDLFILATERCLGGNDIVDLIRSLHIGPLTQLTQQRWSDMVCSTVANSRRDARREPALHCTRVSREAPRICVCVGSGFDCCSLLGTTSYLHSTGASRGD